MSVVIVRSLTKYFGDSLVLDDVSMVAPRNSTTAILGASGCGKTTLLRHINGLLSPDKGEIELFGRPIDYARLTELRRRMGYAVQSVGLFPHLRIRENLSLMARICGWDERRIRSRCNDLMQAMQMHETLLDRFPHELSGGQQQRAGICRAMILAPELLLLDEPFSGVDQITREAIHMEFLTLIRDEPATTLLVTHDVREAQKLASHLVIMEHGRILQQDLLRTVLSNPATDGIARLFHEQIRDRTE